MPDHSGLSKTQMERLALIEYKIAPLEIKAEGDTEGGKYKGHFSVFNNVDDGDDVIEPGAFDKTLKEQGGRVKVLFAHDMYKPVGPTPEVLKEDETGLYAEGKILTDTFWGNETYALLKGGALDEGSIGYRSISDRITNDIRYLEEIQLFEISLVPLGMNALTHVEAVKALMLKGSPLDPVAVGNGAHYDQIDLLAKQINEMGKMIEGGEALITADIDKAKAAGSALKALADQLYEMIAAAGPSDTGHLALQQLKARGRAAKLSLQMATNIN